MSKFLDYTGLQHYHEKVQGEISQLALKLSYLDIAPCDEDGLLFVDEYLNIGVRIDNSGLSAINSITAISL